MKEGKYRLDFHKGGKTINIEYEFRQKNKWQHQSPTISNDDAIYMLMPDRFAKDCRIECSQEGIDENNPNTWHGGNIAGMTKALDYISWLGFAAVWHTPIFKCSDYHGYSIEDFYNIDSHFGILDDYRMFVDSAHSKGLKVVMDIILNHCSINHPWMQALPQKDWMARKKGEDNICHMVTSISSLMRASISNKRSMVYIREEIKYVQDYLYIQETRYGDKFTSYIEVDERLNELEIPKMTIQTLVENAVVHGVENATWDCFLYVSGEITDGMAVFTVKDDGVGMSQEQLEKLMGTEEESDHEAERTHTHLGVYAVRKRLDYVYQNKAMMSITSESGKGTQVILEIPMNGNVGVTYRKCDEPVNENNKKRGDER